MSQSGNKYPLPPPTPAEAKLKLWMAVGYSVLFAALAFATEIAYLWAGSAAGFRLLLYAAPGIAHAVVSICVQRYESFRNLPYAAWRNRHLATWLAWMIAFAATNCIVAPILYGHEGIATRVVIVFYLYLGRLLVYVAKGVDRHLSIPEEPT